MSTITTEKLAAKLWQDVLLVRERKPLVHCITNLVAISYSANILLALGAAPVMAHAKEEVSEMSTHADALVINIGTLQPEWVDAMILAAESAHKQKNSVVFDPVGAGATTYRSHIVQRLLKEAKPDIIRGNASEIMNTAGIVTPTKGVESVYTSDSARHAAKELAKQTGGIICVSGKTDYIVNAAGQQISLDNGHPWMTRITGVGCASTAMIGAFAAIDTMPWHAATAAMASIAIAGEMAAEEAILQNRGVGFMQTALLDKLQLMTKEDFFNRIKIAINE